MEDLCVQRPGAINYISPALCHHPVGPNDPRNFVNSRDCIINILTPPPSPPSLSFYGSMVKRWEAVEVQQMVVIDIKTTVGMVFAGGG